MQPELVNGYPTWKQNSSKNAIWFCNITSEWCFGFATEIGSKSGGIFGPKLEDDWPQNLSGWQYGDGTGTWPNAGSDVVIEDYSDGKL